MAGCYVLDLYCDEPGCEAGQEFHRVQFIAEHGSTCRRRARKAGWRLDKNGEWCPRHAKNLNQSK